MEVRDMTVDELVDIENKIKEEEMKNYPFIDKCVEGIETVDKIDDYIEKWRSSESGKDLYDFLGMSEHEYTSWLDGQDSLENMVNIRKSFVDSIKADIVNNKEAIEESINHEKDEIYKFIDAKARKIFNLASVKATKKCKEIGKRREKNKVAKKSRKKNKK